MDAKPQRPLRPFRIRDENIAPHGPSYKTIHQRNKSSPALSTLAKQQVAGPKLGLPRAVFADLSNTSRHASGAQDDSALLNKKVTLVSLREIGEQENVKPAALSRPAQRPLSVSGIKGFLNNFASATYASTARQPQIDPKLDAESLVVSKKPRAKRSTAVLREIDNGVTQPSAVSTQTAPVRTINPSSQGSDSAAAPSTETNQYLEERSTTTTASLRAWQPTSLADSLHHLPKPYETKHESDARPTYHNYDYQLPQLPSSSDSAEIYVDAPSEFLPQPEPLRPSQALSIVRNLQQDLGLKQLIPVSELDERLSEESYAEHYLEDGYTTVDSFKSKGDFTTGPTTVLLAPRMTSKAEIEITAAREAVWESKQRFNVDEDEQWDTSMVHEYGEDIFSYMNTLEERMRPNPYYMDSQTEIQWFMRSSLMEWLVQVHHTFQMLPETLFLCVNYVDRFLSCKVVSQNKIQLVGATALLVAAKYEEIQCPTISEIRYMAGDSYTVDDILKAERFMLSMLQFELGWPGPMSFLRRISKADDYDLQTRTLAKYFLEVTIMDERFVASIPSYTAAGAHCLARLMLGKGAWSQAHIFYSNYTYTQLRPLMSTILLCCEQPEKHHKPIYEKYADRRFKKASEFVQIELQKGFTLPTVAQMTSWAQSERNGNVAVVPVPFELDEVVYA